MTAVLVFAIGAAGCTGDDDTSDDPDVTELAPDTTRPQLLYETLPQQTATEEDDAFVAGVLSDDTVTAEELDDAYQRYIACIADGGGYGRYAYDLELHTGLVVDWFVDTGAPNAPDADALGASCSRQYLGDLTARYEAANPPGDTYREDVRRSVVACLEAVSPTAAANFPAEVSIDTTGSAASVGELQLTAVGLVGEDASEAEIAAVNACIASLGAEWHDFGEPPPTTG